MNVLMYCFYHHHHHYDQIAMDEYPYHEVRHAPLLHLNTHAHSPLTHPPQSFPKKVPLPTAHLSDEPKMVWFPQSSTAFVRMLKREHFYATHEVVQAKNRSRVRHARNRKRGDNGRFSSKPKAAAGKGKGKVGSSSS